MAEKENLFLLCWKKSLLFLACCYLLGGFVIYPLFRFFDSEGYVFFNYFLSVGIIGMLSLKGWYFWRRKGLSEWMILKIVIMNGVRLVYCQGIFLLLFWGIWLGIVIPVVLYLRG
mgnify:FL=1